MTLLSHPIPAVDSGAILMLSGTIPGEPGVGGVILKDLLESSPAGSVVCAPVPSAQALQLDWMARCPLACTPFPRRFETGWRPFGGVAGELVGWSARNAMFGRHCRQLVRDISHTIATQEIRRVWAVLDCPTVIQIADHIAAQLGVPLSVMVWDAPELLVAQLRLDRWSGRSLLGRFERVLKQADRVGVICEQMQSAYEQRFGAGHYVVMRHGISESLWQPASADRSPHELRIGFAGSMTSPQAFQQLIQVLNACHWKISERSVTLRLIGSRYTLDSRMPQHIEYFGWRTLDETVQLLAECDLLYLPQPFESKLRDLAALSFPTKLTSYLAAGRPVLLHAPEYASIVPLFSKYQFGRWCPYADADALSDVLTQMANSVSGPEIRTAIEKARSEEFCQSVFLSRFRELTGVAAGDSPAKADVAKAAASNQYFSGLVKH